MAADESSGPSNSASRVLLDKDGVYYRRAGLDEKEIDVDSDSILASVQMNKTSGSWWSSTAQGHPVCSQRSTELGTLQSWLLFVFLSPRTHGQRTVRLESATGGLSQCKKITDRWYTKSSLAMQANPSGPLPSRPCTDSPDARASPFAISAESEVVPFIALDKDVVSGPGAE